MTTVSHQTFKRTDKLVKTDDFSSVFDFKDRLRCHFFVLHYKPNQLSHARLGLVVGRKTHKSAVKRNYMRRVMRDLFRTHPARMLLSYDLVIRITRPFEAQDFKVVEQQFQRLIQQLLNKAS